MQLFPCVSFFRVCRFSVCVVFPWLLTCHFPALILFYISSVSQSFSNHVCIYQRFSLTLRLRNMPLTFEASGAARRSILRSCQSYKSHPSEGPLNALATSIPLLSPWFQPGTVLSSGHAFSQACCSPYPVRHIYVCMGDRGGSRFQLLFAVHRYARCR